MANLTSHYLGIELKSPIVVGACDLLENHENLLKLEKAGAGAIVYKSLFEEQIQLEDLELSRQLEEFNERNAEMTSLFPEVNHAGPEEHLYQLKKALKKLTIPLIASLNAVYKDTWVKYASKIANTGVSALELNFYNVPFSFDKTAEEIENEQLDIVEAVIAAVDIPVSVKLSRFYTNPLGMTKKLDNLGVKGVILFNKLFQPDVDIISEKHTTPWNLSSPEEYKLPLRYSGLLSGEINADIIANTGIFTGKDALKVILAGANNVQVVSTLYKNGVNHIESMLKEMADWMDVKGYNSLDDFRGKLSRKNTNNPYVYKRAQYIDIILNSERIMG